ncbi:hypothetical protein MBANPS3_005758 [Mucor bainieri]
MAIKIEWNQLPKELLALIFSNIKKQSDILQLQLVRKNWSEAAADSLYRNIAFSHVNVPLLVKTLIETDGKYRFRVKSIDTILYWPSTTRNYAYDDLLTLLRLCPNITRIQSSNEERSLHADISRLHSQGYLQHLQYIPDPKESSAYSQRIQHDATYDSTALALRKTLARLVIINNRSNNLNQPSHEKAEINLLQHLKDFLQLKNLIVSNTTNELLFEMITFITQRSHTLQELELNLDNFQAASQTQQPPTLDLNQLSRRPNIRRLEITAKNITDRDLQCIQRSDTIHKEVFPSLAAYLDAFNYVIHLEYFQLRVLPVIHGIDEILTFWSKQPQINAIDFAESSFKQEKDLVLLTVKNTKSSKGYCVDMDDDEYDGWLIRLNAYSENFDTFYKQALQQFSRSAIEYISVFAVSIDVGNSLDYIIDHYTYVKDIHLEQVGLSSFHAEAAGKRLERLGLKDCEIEPNVLLQLSSSVQFIGVLDLERCSMLNDGVFSEEILTVNMPETDIDFLDVYHREEFGVDDFSWLIKVCTSSPTLKTQFLELTPEDEIQHLEEEVYLQMCTDAIQNDSLYVQLSIKCRSLQRFRTIDKRHKLTM